MYLSQILANLDKKIPHDFQTKFENSGLSAQMSMLNAILYVLSEIEHGSRENESHMNA